MLFLFFCHRKLRIRRGTFLITVIFDKLVIGFIWCYLAAAGNIGWYLFFKSDNQDLFAWTYIIPVTEYTMFQVAKEKEQENNPNQGDII